MKNIALLIGCLLLSGCLHMGAAEGKPVSVHHLAGGVGLQEKQSVLWTLELINEYAQTSHALLLNDYGYMPWKDERNEEALAELAKELAAGIDTPLRNPTIDQEGVITPGHERVILKEAELVKQLLEVKSTEEEMTMPIVVTEPTVSEEELPGIDAEVLSVFKTHYNSSVAGRATNIELSAEAIQDHVLGPGDSFSFNSVVGERTVERGYQEALEIVNREFVMGIGGGICQTSSTLYNAVEGAGLEMIERYSHSREVGYVPAGRDATVSWGGPDFQFKNAHQFPVILRTEVSHEQGELTIKVLSHKVSNS